MIVLMKTWIFLSIFLLYSCAHRPPPAAPPVDPNIAIKSAVEDALMVDPRVRPLAPQVEVSKGVVTLSGVVTNQLAREAAQQDALNTEHVRAVVNLMDVRAPETGDIKLRAEMALAQSLTREQRKNINVDVEGNVVVLKGIVKNNFVREKAWFADANVEGVDSVRNELRIVREETSGKDKILEDEINYRLMWDPELEWLNDKVDVKVKNRIAILTGEVDSREEKRAVLMDLKDAGIRKVVDRLKII